MDTPITALNPGTTVLESQEQIDLQLTAKINRLVSELEALYRAYPTHSALQRFAPIFTEETEKSLSAGWHEKTFQKLLEGVRQSVLHPEALIQFQSDPLFVLREIPQTMRDKLELPSPEQARGAILKSLQSGHDGK